ncbi:Trm112 family protein [Aeromonas rivipollensis]|uniref:Trm112 family protein n=1 Tax=Aeromonas rivipollensis TaxID=948519 RepID=UPI0038CF54F6
MALDIKLLDIIACPVCKGKLHYQPQSDKAAHELICRFDRLAYPLEERIPVLLENRARHLPLEELKP